MKSIAIIIPVYKAHATIKQTLCSIGTQRDVDYTCYLVVDGEEVGSYDYLKNYAYLGIPIKIFYMEQNGGPGVARQYGIDNTDEEFITFIDSDDTYVSSIALYQQQLAFRKNTTAVSVTSFAEEHQDHTLSIKQNDTIWMHGKMYRRAFLDKYDIRFNDTRANEDIGFNTQCQCYANEQEEMVLSHNITYLWQWRSDSIVRSNNHSYIYNDSIEGYVVNKIYAFTRVLDRMDMNDSISYLIVAGLIAFYDHRMIIKQTYPSKLHIMNKWSKKYYNTLYTLVSKSFLKQEESIFKQKSKHSYTQYIQWKKKIGGK